MKQKVLIILGPTASGKSDLAVQLAKKFKGEVISADSRQVYKGLDIGTGKITKKEMRGVPHHLLDVANPKKYFSVSDYKKLALLSLRYIETKKKLPIICGGTGFYIDALIGKINLPEVPPNKALRKKLEKLSAEKLYKMLLKKDSRRAKEIDPRNKVRVIRALEIVETLGKVPHFTSPLDPSPRRKERGEYEYIFVDCPPSLGLLTLNSLSAADSVLIPIQCEYYALEGLSQLLNTVHLVQKNLNKALQIEGVLLTMYDSRLRLSNQIFDEVKRYFGHKVFRTIVSRNIRLSEAPSFGKPIILYDALSSGTRNYMELAKEVMANRGEMSEILPHPLPTFNP